MGTKNKIIASHLHVQQNQPTWNVARLVCQSLCAGFCCADISDCALGGEILLFCVHIRMLYVYSDKIDDRVNKNVILIHLPAY